jgi:acyl-CoA synthetase (AMP-forming)/AMP-acid ligase II
VYPGLQAKIRPQQPAFIMAQRGETVTYAELERRSNRLTHFLRAIGLCRLDHCTIFVENNAPRGPLTPALSLNGAVATSIGYTRIDIRSHTPGGADTGPTPGPLSHRGDDTVLG